MSELTREIRDKRVAVARDVIERIALGRARYVPGSYMRRRDYNERWRTGALTEDVQGCADFLEGECSVCLLGGLLLSKARLFNAVPFAKFDPGGYFTVSGRQADGAAIADVLADVFDPATLATMEAAFELAAGYYNSSPLLKRLTDAEIERLQAGKAFGHAFGDQSELYVNDRVLAVMNNLIANDGEFVPEQLPVTEGAASDG